MSPIPYIPKARRKPVWWTLLPRNPGELNYLISKICRDYLEEHGPADYELYNSVIGVLECAKQELYRRVIAGYENEKWAENGDI